MNEIEKLMQNAGIKLQYGYDVEYNNKDEHYRLLDCNKNAVITLFPEYRLKGYKVTKVNKTANFTTEKQLELIKWLAKHYDVSFMWVKERQSFNIIVRSLRTGRMNASVCGFEIDINETIAYLLNHLWQDLTEEEKAEIRRILE